MTAKKTILVYLEVLARLNCSITIHLLLDTLIFDRGHHLSVQLITGVRYGVILSGMRQYNSINVTL